MGKKKGAKAAVQKQAAPETAPEATPKTAPERGRASDAAPAADRVNSAERERRLKRLLEDGTDLCSNDSFHLSEREVSSLRSAFDKTMANVPLEKFSALAKRCSTLLKSMEDRIAGDDEAQTGDADCELTGADAWKFVNIPRHRRLQTLVVSVLLFFTGMPMFLGAGFVLMVTPLWPFMLAYWIYIIMRGGIQMPNKRRRWYSRSRIWRYYRDYFPIRLIIPEEVKAQLTPDRNYIFGYHPHGVHSFGAMINFGSDGTNISDRLPGITIHTQTLSINYWVPFWREFMIYGGSGDASAKCIRKTLAAGPGESVALVIGGAEESLMASPKTNDLTLSKRRGFVKIALQTGSPLVPTYGFGETNVYGNWADGKPKILGRLKWLQKRIGFAIPLIKGRGFFNYNFGPLPHRRQIVTVIGAPVVVPKIENPTQADIDEWHGKYVEALFTLYRENKPLYDLTTESEARVVT